MLTDKTPKTQTQTAQQQAHSAIDDLAAHLQRVQAHVDRVSRQ